MPRTLYLLRHAKSGWDDPALADHDRPLAPRGRRASKAIAGHVRETGIAPDLVLCSTSVRTRETLARVSSGFDGAKGVPVQFDGGIYEASGDDLLRMLRDVPADIGSVMLVGHQPAMQDLALKLAGGGERLGQLAAKFPTGALATLDFRGPWSDIDTDSARLVGFVKPRELE